MTRTRAYVFCLAIGVFLLLVAGQAHAERFSFYSITNNEADDAAIGEAQLFMDVTPIENSDFIQFDFRNTGPQESTINAVYFDFNDNELLMADTINIINNEGVSFSEESADYNVTPRVLPGGNGQDVEFSITIAADADVSLTTCGVNPGEQLGVTFQLASSKSHSDVISGLESGQLRVGLHVIGFEGGGSESFVNNPNPVPEPTTFLLLAPGLIGLALLRKRFRRT